LNTSVKSVLRPAGIVVAALIVNATPAFPQAIGSPAPAGALFASADGRRVHHGLDVSVSVVEGYDSDAPPVLGAGSGDTLLSGASTFVIGNADYRWQGSRVQVGATGSSVLRNYSKFQDADTVSYSAGVGLSARLGGRTTLFANQTIAYSPSYLYLLFPNDGVQDPGDSSPAAPDYTITHTDSHLYGTTLSLTRGLTSRSQFSATGEFQYSDFASNATPDQNFKGIRGEYSRGLSKNVLLRAGYRFRTGQFGYLGSTIATEPEGSATDHGVDVAIDYSRKLSATRRMVVEFSVGSSRLSMPKIVAPDSPASPFVEMTAEVAIDYQFSTSWAARGRYRRGLEYIAPLGGPVFADGFTAELSGLLNPRLDVLASTRYSSGASAQYQASQRFDTYGTEVRIRYALTRSWALYGQYIYYFYDFHRDMPLPSGVPSGLERNGLRAGVTLWVPAVRK
jgi:hypothetical protein